MSKQNITRRPGGNSRSGSGSGSGNGRGPGNLDALRVQSINAAAAGQHARAIELARRYHARRPRDVGVLNHLASTHQKMGDWEGGLKWGRRSYELEPIPHHLNILIRAYIQLDRLRPLRMFCADELKRRGFVGCLRDLRVASILLRFHLGASRRLFCRAVADYFRRRAEARRRRREAARYEAARREAARRAAEAQAAPRPEKPAALEAPEWPVFATPPLPLDIPVDETALRELADLPRGELAQRCPCLVLPSVYVKKDGVADLFHADFQALNAKLELKGTHESIGEYLGVGLAYEAQSGGREDGLLEVWINVDTGALLTFPPHALDDAATAGADDAAAFKPLSPRDIAALATRGLRKARIRVDEALRPQLRTAQTEWERAFTAEQSRRRSAWESAGQPPAATAAGETRPPPGSPSDSLDEKRVATLRATLTAAVADFDAAAMRLAKEHTVPVAVSALDVRRLRLPVMLCTVLLTRRKATRTLLIPYNPLLRRLEPVACTHCDRDGYTLGATDTGEPLCASCVRPTA